MVLHQRHFKFDRLKKTMDVLLEISIVLLVAMICLNLMDYWDSDDDVDFFTFVPFIVFWIGICFMLIFIPLLFD